MLYFLLVMAVVFALLALHPYITYPLVLRLAPVQRINDAKVTTIPNWGAIKNIPEGDKDNPWARSHGLADKFVFAYSGTLGLKHNPDLLVALADKFADTPQVEVVVAASGLGLDKLKATLDKHPRGNIRLMPLVDFAHYAEFLATADVLVAVLEKDAGRFSVPSKVLSYFCAGRAILLSAPLDNQAAKLVQDVGAGRATAPNDVEDFLAAAEALHADPAERLEAGHRSRTYAEQNFSINGVADRFERVFTGVAA